MTRRSLRKILADARGAAALELAMVMPVLVTFIMGIWYLGWSLNLGGEARHAVELASRIYITNPNATASQLQSAVASHLSDVPISQLSLSTSTSTIGTAASQHITWSFSTTPPIPFISAIPISFSGAYDVPAATP